MIGLITHIYHIYNFTNIFVSVVFAVDLLMHLHFSLLLFVSIASMVWCRGGVTPLLTYFCTNPPVCVTLLYMRSLLVHSFQLSKRHRRPC